LRIRQSRLQTTVDGQRSAMDFRILGPLEVRDGERLVPVAGAKQRALLAALLLHANEVVSTDRLIDELWDEAPPPTAASTLRVHVSRLRKAMNGHGEGTAAEGRLETRGTGYLLRVAPGELDADRFGTLLEEARRTLAEGDPAGAVERVELALGLWRGQPLADFTYDRFAQAEIARLEELRVAAREEQFEAELALGRHGELVGELELLVRQHPLRERLRGQLMLALYRADRQGEALQVYQEGRRAFAEELGLEPSASLQRLERQILEHDAALEPPPIVTPRRPARRPTRRRRRLLAVGVTLAVAGAVAVVAVALWPDEGSSERDLQADAGVALLDPATGAVEDLVPLGTAPANVAVGEGAVWVLDANDRTVSRVDPARHGVDRTFSTGGTPTTLAAGAGAVWVGIGGDEGAYPTSVARIDPASGVVDASIELPPARTNGYMLGGGVSQQLIAATDEAIWVVDQDQQLVRIDPRTNRVVATVAGARARGVAAAEGAVWVIEDNVLVEVDPTSNSVARRIEVDAGFLTTLAVGAGAVWAADPLGGNVWRIDPRPEPQLTPIHVGLGVEWVAAGPAAVWATNTVDGQVHRIDPATNQATAAGALAGPAGLAVAEDGVWVSAAGSPARDAVLPASVCGDVVYAGSGPPQALIVSDLPLQGAGRRLTAAMEAGIRLVLERRGFRAGRLSVGYQSCDVSTAQEGNTDIFRCFANARAYARTPNVLGVIGPFHSFCSSFEIPITNQATDGPLAMISPSNTYTGLTRTPTGGDPGELVELYPTGVRNFVRLAATDLQAAAAMAEAARQLGVKRLAILWDGEDSDMAAFAQDVRAAAASRDVAVSSFAPWDPFAERFDELARQVAAARADGVILAGAAPPHVQALLRELRDSLESDAKLLAHDGFAGLSPADAEGLYVENYGIPNAELPPAGRQLLAELEARGGDAGPDLGAAYGAQAAELLLDAIARSDGTRRSVSEQLRLASVTDGLLGDVRFDELGDLVRAPVTIYRMTAEGLEVERVVTVP
jgi:DNA-binding SARP family transcriptional activator/ABC-type branched-subunit amino acid transport system substrate-binding protein